MDIVFGADFLSLLASNWQLVTVGLLTVFAVVLFVGELLEIELVALLVMGVLMVTGIISPQEGLRGFSNPATITIACMFVLSEGLRRTGLVNQAGTVLSSFFSRYDYRVAMIGMMVMTGLLSGFINNTAVVAIFLPVVLDATRNTEVSATKALMALSFSAMFGGVCTLIGTSTNILVSSIITEYQMEPIGMFEMAPLGLVSFAFGAAYMLTAGDYLIPERDGSEELTESFEMGEFLTELEVTSDAPEPELPRKLDAFIPSNLDLNCLEIVRDGETLPQSQGDLVVEAGDVIRVRGPAEAIHELISKPGIVIRPEAELTDAELTEGEAELFQAVVAPNSMLANNSLNEVDFDETFTAKLLAIRRRGDLIHHDLMNIELRGGDVLLLQAPSDRINQIQRHPAFVVMSEVGLSPFRQEKVLPAVLTIGGVIATAAFGFVSLQVSAWLSIVLMGLAALIQSSPRAKYLGGTTTIVLAGLIPLGMAVDLPIVATAIAGALLMTLGGILTPSEAYESINWQVIMLLAGLIPLGTALENTGGVALISDSMMGVAGGFGAIALLAVTYLMTVLLTGIMSNQATAILFAPLAVELAHTLGVNPRPFVFAVTFAASASFLTPVGYQTNTLIYGAGKYEFTDFLKAGTPLTLLFWVIAVMLIPIIWPL
jgi:di/tricarboxylate transporter